MLRSVKEIYGYKIQATDGSIGEVEDFYFDDGTWFIEYLVADTRRWLPGRKVLISTLSLGKPDWETKSFPVNLTKEQVEQSPDVDTEKPISQQLRDELGSYYTQIPHGAVGWIGASTQEQLGNLKEHTRFQAGKQIHTLDNPNLRSAREVKGYTIHATDGEMGHAEDFIIDDDTGIIRYVVVDTRNWLPGKKVIISPTWIKDIWWSEHRVAVDVTRHVIEKSPEYNASMQINREYEQRLYDYYGRPIYWK